MGFGVKERHDLPYILKKNFWLSVGNRLQERKIKSRTPVTAVSEIRDDGGPS